MSEVQPRLDEVSSQISQISSILQFYLCHTEITEITEILSHRDNLKFILEGIT